MRLLTSLPDEQPALKLVAYLAVEGIQTKLEEDEDQWEIWVLQDDDREQAKEILAHFEQHPEDERYSKAERKVRNTLKEASRIKQQKDKHAERLKKRWEGSWWHCYPATYIIIGLCCLVAVIGTKPEPGRGLRLVPLCNKRDSVLVEKLRILPRGLVDKNENGDVVPVDFLYSLWPNEKATIQTIREFAAFRVRITAEAVWFSIASGEFWRPLTPAFLHFSFLHILFNMMLMLRLGGAIEFERGTARFIGLCCVIAVVSNVAQLAWGGPNFGGMSGVDLGLIGYLWMKGKTEPTFGLAISQRALTFTIFFVILCMTGAIGAVANAAHLVGLGTGMVIGARKAIWRKLPFTG